MRVHNQWSVRPRDKGPVERPDGTLLSIPPAPLCVNVVVDARHMNGRTVGILQYRGLTALLFVVAGLWRTTM